MHHITAIDYLMSTFGSLTLNLSLLSEKSITPLSLHTRTETLNRVAPPHTTPATQIVQTQMVRNKFKRGAAGFLPWSRPGYRGCCAR